MIQTIDNGQSVFFNEEDKSLYNLSIVDAEIKNILNLCKIFSTSISKNESNIQDISAQLININKRLQNIIEYINLPWYKKIKFLFRRNKIDI